MSRIKLERSPSISSCFPERFSGPSPEISTSTSGKSYPTTSYSHQVPRSMPSLPETAVDKHLVIDINDHGSSVPSPAASQLHGENANGSLQRLQSLFSTFPNSAPATLCSERTVTIELTKQESVSAPASINLHSKPAASPLPAPPMISHGNRRTTGLTLYAPLYQAAMKGDWEKADVFIKSHPGAINVRITKEMDTILHIAAAAKHNNFVEEVIRSMTPTDLALRNKYNNTALCYAAASGVTKIAEMMVGKNGNLPMMRNYKGVTPLHIAALFGHKDMVWYLYSVTSDECLTRDDYIGLLIATINTDLFDVALSIIQHQPELAIQRDLNGETALHVLARKSSAFASKSGLGIWHRVIYPCQHMNLYLVCLKEKLLESQSYQFISLFSFTVPGIKAVYDKKLMHTQVLELVKLLWEQVLLLDDSQIAELLASPSQPLFVAAEFGIVEFITALLRSYPDLIWKGNEQSRSIFHIAVAHRQEKVFSLINDIGAHKEMITAYKDINNATILHLAGMIAPRDKLNVISGAALQMQRELLWFKEVEKNVQPSLREMRDNNGRTPRMIFTEEHRGLVKEGEKWMKNTASSCMLLATLITTVMFAAIFTVPGGNDNNRGTPIVLASTSFIIFAVADAFALFSSVTSILMFLSILTSRYAEEDFVESLPKRLVVGLATLFCSIAAMLVAFAATFCIVLDHRLTWIVVPVSLGSSVPVTLFAFLQFPLFVDMIHSLYGAGIFARKSIDMLY
ncbi:ankyrin repeat family protein [Salix suchowensis]|nr:ankyrin repeat family protein [Salix suchowensis]